MYPVTVQASQTVTVTASNKEAMGQIRVTKTNANPEMGDYSLAGSIFDVYQNGEVVTSITVDSSGNGIVVFHSFRHSSTTYKLKLNHGDIKATQGDTGHSQADMITRVYAHILDEDRKINAQKFESAFYANPDLRDVKPPKEQSATINLNDLIEQLKNSPELAQTLAGLIAGNAC